jgi:hypothetical protein
MAFLGAGSTASALVPGLVLVGIGTGLVAPGIAGAALAAVPQERAGMAGGARSTPSGSWGTRSASPGTAPC